MRNRNSPSLSGTPIQLKIFPLFTIAGWLLILTVFIIGAFFLAPTTANYLGAHAKAARDAAEGGSAILNQLQFIVATPMWLVPLVFVGIASFVTGIAIEFSTIPNLIRQRGNHLTAALPLLLHRPVASSPQSSTENERHVTELERV